MEHKALYRKWRPKTFDEVYGQDHITSVLRYEAMNDAFNHAYLFCGSRGTGKTTCAKILAKVINCEHPVDGNPCGKCSACLSIEQGTCPDVVEMDAASNNRVDDAREIKESVDYTPTELKKKVFIVDEVHMMTTQAFNALLKTLEEPPEHIVFILATTDLQKLPATIVSRCQRFDFHRISTEKLIERLQYIAKEEGIQLSNDAGVLIARQSQGGMRDAISMLELCSSADSNVTEDSVRKTVGIIGRDTAVSCLDAMISKNYELLFRTVDDIVSSSIDLTQFINALSSVYRDLLVRKTVVNNSDQLLDLTDQEKKQLDEFAAKFSREKILFHCKLLQDTMQKLADKTNTAKRLTVEMMLIRMCDSALDHSYEALADRIQALENGKIREKPADNIPVQTKEKKTPTVESKPKQQAVQPPSASKEKQLKNWAETVEEYAQKDRMRSAFLANSRAFEKENGEIVVKTSNSIGIDQFNNPDAFDTLRMILSRKLNREIGEKQLSFQLISTEEEQDILDEFTN